MAGSPHAREIGAPEPGRTGAAPVREGLLYAWAGRWRAEVVPLRLELGFVVSGACGDPARVPCRAVLSPRIRLPPGWTSP
ncbi:hypothetical protein QFZ75_006270 [Streptomyces sp. V3I8]|nr:hypothetical protein [Streptomyces sp. V3I8]